MSRALRRHHIKRLGKNRRRWDWRSENPDIAPPLSDNELATRHPLDCGRHCVMCHPDKFINPKKRRLTWKREDAALMAGAPTEPGDTWDESDYFVRRATDA